MSLGDETQETPMPEAPKAASPSLDPSKVNPASQPNGSEYLAEKGDMLHPEALLNRFRELSESNDPVSAILVTEVQEVKEYLQSISMAATISVGLLACMTLCSVMVARKVIL